MTVTEHSGVLAVAEGHDRVLEFIRSPESVASILPHVEEHRIQDGVSMVKFRIDLERGGVSPGGGYISTAKAVMKFRYGAASDNGVTIEGSGRALGSSLKLSLEIAVGKSDGSTQISWRAVVDTGVLMKLLGSETVQAITAGIIGEILENARKALSPGRTTE